MKKLVEKLKFAYNFVRYDIWKITGQELSKTRRLFYNIIKTIYLAIKGFQNDRLGVQAAALTYSITFAIIPLFALITAVSRGFGIESSIENILQNSFLSQSDFVNVIMEFIGQYLDTLRGGFFIGIGLIILIYSVYRLFARIEMTLNKIWQVEKSRSFIKQFTMYFSSVLILPILLAVSSGLSIYVNNIMKETFLFDLFSPLVQASLTLLPFLASSLVFTIIYLIIPNTKVRFVNALIAGLIAGVVFQAFQALYVSGQINLTRYNAVYGGFAAIPLLLLWLNISSLIFLIGAEICYVSQNLRYYDYRAEAENISQHYKRNLSLFVVYVIVKRLQNNEPPLSEEEIVTDYKLPIRIVNQILGDLTKSNILVMLIDEKNRRSYLPSIDISQLTISKVDKMLNSHGSNHFIETENELMNNFWVILEEVERKTDRITGEVYFKDI